MTAGLPLADRRALRARWRAAAVAAAERKGLTIRCQSLADDMDNPGHQRCRGEDRGGAGCLCRCHDKPAPEPDVDG